MIIRTEKGLSHVLSEIEQLPESEAVAFDFETNGDDALAAWSLRQCRVVGLSLAYRGSKALRRHYIPVGHEGFFSGEQLTEGTVLERLKSMFEDQSRRKVAHNAKFDTMVLAKRGIETGDSVDCTMIMHWLWDPDARHGLKLIARDMLNRKMRTFGNVTDGIDFASVDVATAAAYSCDDAANCWRLREHLIPLLKALDLWDDYTRIEVPYMRLLRNMEMRGIQLDIPYLKELEIRLSEERQKVESKLAAMTGVSLNWGSPDQVADYLFINLRLSPLKHGKRRPSADDETLRALAPEVDTQEKPIISLIQRHRGYSKMYGTYVKGFLRRADRDGCVHSSFGLASTGRLRSSKPNVQNTPRSGSEPVYEDGSPVGIRQMIIAHPGYVLAGGDESQVELRLQAHFSQDPFMMNAYLVDDGDLHYATIDVVKEIVSLTISRDHAKTLNFGLSYGLSVYSIKNRLNCTEAVAQKLYYALKTSRKGLVDHIAQVVRTARATGMVRTLFKRIRRFPEINSDDWKLKSEAERQAFNTEIQGSAADVIKGTQLELDKRHGDSIFQVLQIHDEIIIEIPDGSVEEIEEARREASKVFSETIQLSVPLAGKFTVGNSLADTK